LTFFYSIESSQCQQKSRKKQEIGQFLDTIKYSLENVKTNVPFYKKNVLIGSHSSHDYTLTRNKIKFVMRKCVNFPCLPIYSVTKDMLNINLFWLTTPFHVVILDQC